MQCLLQPDARVITCIALLLFAVAGPASAQQTEPATQLEPPEEVQELKQNRQLNEVTANGNTQPDQTETRNGQTRSPQQEPGSQQSQSKEPRSQSDKSRQQPPALPQQPSPVRMDRPELPPSLQKPGQESATTDKSPQEAIGETEPGAFGRRPGNISPPAGLLTQHELDLLATRINRDEVRTYQLYTGDNGSMHPMQQKNGLLLMRNPDHMQHIGGNYYHDGRGNLILFGLDVGETDNKQTYAMTLFAGGGQQLVVDMNGDHIVDAGVSEGLEDQFGFLAAPSMQHALECLQRQISAGDSPTRALPNCLNENNSSAGNGGGGTHAGDQLESAVEPDCGSDQSIAPGGFSQDGGMNVVGEFWSGGSTRDGENHTVLLEDSATGERTKADVVGWVGNERDSRTLKIEDSETGEELGLVKRNGDGTADHNPPPEPDMEFSLEEADNVETDDESQAESGGKKQPGPGPGGIQGSGSGNDPRCREPSTWNRLATEECANNMTDCLKRMHDVIYAATGGRCETGTGPADGTRIQCKSNDSAGDCFAEGGSTTECLEKHAGDDDGGVAQSENDDLFNDRRGNVGYGLMDVHPFGATLAAMCRKGGGAGPCGDPAPTAGAAAEHR